MDREYIHSDQQHNLKAPAELVPVVLSFVKPKSVLDVGCGIGTWLHVFQAHGVTDVIGVDASYVDRSQLHFTADRFVAADLRQPLSLGRKFDLVISLEVAEHLPESVADQFVSSLVEHGDVILFSAAVPGQGGQNHLNEQWPKYWATKFGKHGFYFHDVIRPVVWENSQVDWWYRQNMFLVTRERSTQPIFSYVHPQAQAEHLKLLNDINKSVRSGGLGMLESLKIFFRSVARAVGRRNGT